MPTISLELPFPPTANNYYFRSKFGGHARTKEASDYMKQIERTVFTRPLFGPVLIHVDVYRPRKIGDLDNTLKVLLDSLNGHVWLDDAQIVEIKAVRKEERPGGLVVLFAAGERFCTDEEIEAARTAREQTRRRRRATRKRTLKLKRPARAVYVPPTGLPPLP